MFFRTVTVFVLYCLIGSLLLPGMGYAAGLPDVGEMLDRASIADISPQIVSFEGPLSPQQSRAAIEQLRESVNSTDILERYLAVMESIAGSPITRGNKVTLHVDGKAAYAAKLKAIENARDHINLESYIIEDDEAGKRFADPLLRKQAEGVQVNLVYDSIGSRKTPASYFQRLSDGGVEVVEFNPLNPLKAGRKWKPTHRNHRKMLIVDGAVAITGGINISRVYSSRAFRRKGHQAAPGQEGEIHWRDTNIQIEGPAVREFQKLFLDTWFDQRGERLPEERYFPGSTEAGSALVRVIGSTPGETGRVPFIAYVSAISCAEHSIYITNAYFIPDDQILKALMDAAKRGVDVKIIVPGITDVQIALHAQRHYYSRLLEAGVEIYEHTASLLHAKTAVIDSVWSTVGSTNLDYQSLLRNDEINAVILNHEFALEMEEMFARDLAGSREIDRDEWEKRPLFHKIRSWFFALFARWL